MSAPLSTEGRRQGLLGRRPARKAPKRLTVALVLSGLSLMLAACGSGANASSSSAPASSTKVPLVLYAAEGYDAAMAAAFQKSTGIPVRLNDDSTGPLLAKVVAERNNPQWGILWVDGTTAFAGLDQQGLLYRGFEPKVNFTGVGQANVPSDKSYVPTGFTLMPGIVYNSSVLSPSQLPKSYSDLLQPAWQGAVGMNDPAVSGPTYPFVAGLMNQLGGVSQGESYFTKLKANGLHVYQTNSVTLNSLEAGTIKVALIQSSAGIGASLKTPNIKVAFLPKATVLPGAIGIDKKASPTVRAEAERFINFVLSAKGQKVQQSGDPAGDSLYWPVLQGIAPTAGLPALAGIATQTIDPFVWGPREGSINQWFTQNITT
jgi:iron(III) transport system substrate-binding protein